MMHIDILKKILFIIAGFMSIVTNHSELFVAYQFSKTWNFHRIPLSCVAGIY